MIKIVTISDIHIKNLKYHLQYKTIFEKLYQKLKEIKPDYILNLGDTCNSKCSISSEYVDLASDLLKSLADMAETHIILGNHDSIVRNKNRQDAVTPIVKALNHPNLFIHKFSCEVLLKENIVLNVMSIYDRENWIKPSNLNAINIALFHGPIKGVETETGWLIDHGEDISIFESFDYVMAGDIHKTNQVLDARGKARYPGSLIQQSFAESDDKGFLLWEIEDKEKFDVTHYPLSNPSPFITIELTSKGKIPKNIQIQKGAKIRLVSNDYLPFDVVKQAVEIVKTKFNPESVVTLNKVGNNKLSITSLKEDDGDLRNIKVQEVLIKDYLKDYNLSDDLLNNVYELNKKYNSLIEQDEDVLRNVYWRLKSVEWDNLFNYGVGNRIVFDNLKGVVGILGKNYQGKSSVVDSILYTIYNTTSKNERKNYNIINQHKNTGRGRVEIEIGNKIYIIERNSEKYEKKLHGNVSEEAKTEVDFREIDMSTGDEVSFNSETRNETDKLIRRTFGTIEDFLLTSMSSQFGGLSFISEGSTKRKEILAKFLDLENNDKKFKLAKEDSSYIKGALKRLEGKDFDKEIEKAQESLNQNKENLINYKAKCKEIKVSVEKIKQEIEEIDNLIATFPEEIISIEKIEESLKEKKELFKDLSDENDKLDKQIEEDIESLKKINNFIENTFDVEEYKDKKTFILDRQKFVEEINDNIKQNEIELQYNKQKKGLLEEVPCGKEYSHCKFIKDAYEAVEIVEALEDKIDNLKKDVDAVREQINNLEPDKIEKYLQNYEKLIEKKNSLTIEVASKELQRQKNETELVKIKQIIYELVGKKENYEKNKQIIENYEKFINSKKDKEAELVKQENELENCETMILRLVRDYGSAEQKVKDIEGQKQEVVNLREQYKAYDLFMRCVHSNGISYEIIKRKMPIINEEIAKVLANVVDFEVFFKSDEKRLDIFIRHPRHDPRPIEMGSGAEKEITAMAIRIALTKISNLSKSNVFFLDEPAVTLDDTHIDGFIRILDMIKNDFEIVVLISHLEVLKDTVDLQIEIGKDMAGFAHIEQEN